MNARKNLLPLAATLMLFACGDGSSDDTRTTRLDKPIVTNPDVRATIVSVSPSTNLIPGVRDHSLTVVGDNLLGVNFALNDVPCRNGRLVGPRGGVANWRATITCDIPASTTGIVMLRASESTNLSDISNVDPVPLALAPAGTVPSLDKVDPQVVARGQQFNFVITGVGLGALVGKRDGMGITVDGNNSLSCYPWITELSADNTSGKLRCLATKAGGPGKLRWHYDGDRQFIEAGVLTITP